MQIKQELKFQPVIITLENTDEVEAMMSIIRSRQLQATREGLEDSKIADLCCEIMEWLNSSEYIDA